MGHATITIIACFHPDKPAIEFVNIPTATAIANAATQFDQNGFVYSTFSDRSHKTAPLRP
jgi:hypothetical protein